MSAATKAKTARGRAGVAARIIIRSVNTPDSRAFDDCFEMFDGDEVAKILKHRAETDKVFAWHVLRHWHRATDLGPNPWWLSKAAARNIGCWNMSLESLEKAVA